MHLFFHILTSAVALGFIIVLALRSWALNLSSCLSDVNPRIMCIFSLITHFKLKWISLSIVKARVTCWILKYIKFFHCQAKLPLWLRSCLYGLMHQNCSHRITLSVWGGD
jgi:transcription elongation factor GreA-like protein